MRKILFLLQKEFLQIRRDKRMLPIIFVVPFIQLLILVQAATFEMKHIRMHVIDLDRSSTSRELLTKFSGSPFYELKQYSFSEARGEDDLLSGRADMVFQIPEGFEKDLATRGKAEVQLTINAINASSAGLINGYTLGIISDFNRQILLRQQEAPAGRMAVIGTTYTHWFNPELNYKNYMVPGILVLLVTLIGMFLSGMNIVREKEAGTIEQINVTPIRKYQFITGKLLPFWIIALFELAFGLVIGKILYGIPMLGSLPLLFAFAALYLLVVLGLGLFISTINNTQQQAMFVSFFFMIVFILMSGLFTPVESMPDWAQKVNVINPVAYFIKVTRMILLKGSGFRDILPQFVSISVFAVVVLSLAIRRYRKTA